MTASIDFLHVWDLYDYKVGKTKAQKAWEMLDYEDQQLCLEVIPKYVSVTHKDGTFPSRAHLATYLNQRRFEDEELPVAPEQEPLLTYYEMLESGVPIRRFEAVPIPGKSKPMWRKKTK